MSKSVVITRPNHDLLTNLLLYWSEAVVQLARKKEYRVCDLKAQKANRDNFRSYVLKNNPVLVFLNGHGSKNRITGYDDQDLVRLEDSDNILKDTVVYARSCDAGAKLGPECVRRGTVAFIGYKRKYVLVHSTARISKPLSDNIAKLFIEPSNLVPSSLLKGNCVKDAYRKSQQAMRRAFLSMQSSEASDDERYAAPFLWGNIKAQTVLGDNNATL